MSAGNGAVCAGAVARSSLSLHANKYQMDGTVKTTTISALRTTHNKLMCVELAIFWEDE